MELPKKRTMRDKKEDILADLSAAHGLIEKLKLTIAAKDSVIGEKIKLSGGNIYDDLVEYCQKYKTEWDSMPYVQAFPLLCDYAKRYLTKNK